MEPVLIILFALLVILAYAWIGYPLVMMVAGRIRPGPRQIGKRGEYCPPVVILFSAHNEETVIRQRLENLAALDYPADRIRVLVGVDGGTDRTAGIAREWADSHPNVEVVVRENNQGKTAMLKLLSGSAMPPAPVPGAAGGGAPPVLAFTDANTMFAPDALRHLVAPLSDPRVGGVCGRLIFLDPEDGMETRENLYWRAETLMKHAESRLDSCLGANGAIYAMRAELFWSDIPDNTIVDDFVLGMKVREQGFRMLYEPRAIAREPTPARIGEEWRRRVRIGAGAFQAMGLCGPCLRPGYGRFAAFFWSHKILRWFTPHLMILLAVSALLCAWSGERISVLTGQATLAAGAVFAGLAVAGRLLGTKSRLKAFDYFASMQAALFAGFLRYCRGGLQGAWERTAR